MAGTLSDYLNNKLLNFVFNGAAFTPPTTGYLALYTATPTSAGGGTEVSGGSYARVAVPFNVTNFPTTSTQIVSLAVLKDFITATASWGSVVALGLFDTSVGGNLLVWDDFTPTAVADTETVRINIGGLTIALS